MLISYHLPPKKLTNEDLAAEFEHPDWTPEKIYRNVGVKTRYIADRTVLASDLAVSAAERLFDEYGISREDVDFLLLSTQHPDYIGPSTVCIVQDKLGLPTTVGTLRTDFGCTGFVYGLLTAKGLIASGEFQNILFINSEVQSRYYHRLDRSGRVLFSDCATATFITPEDLPKIGRFAVGTDGKGAKHIWIPAGGTAMPCSDETRAELTDKSGNIRTLENVHMDGLDVYAFSRRVAPQLIRDTLERNGLTMDDIDLFVSHQASPMILRQLMKGLGLSEKRFLIDIEDVGNTASCSIPLAIRRAQEHRPELFCAGAKVLVAGFGIGYSWAGTVLTF